MVPARPDALDEVLSLAEGLDEQEWIVLARTARAEAYWLEGRLDEPSTSLPPPRPEQHGRARSNVARWRSGATASRAPATSRRA